MERWLIRIADYLLTQSWQIAVLTIAVALASFLLRNRSAHVRYLLWLIVLAKCLVPPLYSIPVAVLPLEEPPVYTPAPPIAERMVVEYRVPQAAVSESAGPAFAASAEASSPKVIKRPARYDPRAWLALGWLAGVIALSFYYLFNALRTQIWLQRWRKALPRESGGSIESFFAAHGAGRMPRVWLLDRIRQPFVWGLVRGSIYLPTELLDDKHARFQASLLGHEFSHVLRFDAVINSLQVLAQTVFWFHPFVWWANRKIRAEREKCCDEMTIARWNTRPEEYSEAIVETLAAKYEQARPVPSLAVAGQVKNIEERIRTMLKPGKRFHSRPSWVAATIVLLVALVTIPTALVLTVRAENLPPTDSADADRIFGNPTNLGPSVNSPAEEYNPSISADELELYFNSLRAGGQADLWVTTRKTKADPWDECVNLGPTVNSPAGEKTPCISADGLSLYFGSDRSGGYGAHDLWVTTRKTKSAPWGEPVNLGPTINSPADELSPSISTDGLDLYFSGHPAAPELARPGGSGESDLWVTKRKTTRDPWGAPVNLGPTVNSSSADGSPSVSGDGLSLYFNSDRPGGYSAGDVRAIWMTTRKSTSDPWDAPVNLGPAVNAYWEVSPNISRDGSTLYFHSRRPGGVGGADIWQAILGRSTPESKAESEQPRFAARTFNSKMAFYVFVHENLDWSWDGLHGKLIGRTPSDTPLQIPACWVWCVQPEAPVEDWDLFLREMSQNSIPGLKPVGKIGDSDLTRLAGCTGLKFLDMSYTGITDAGLARLRDMTGLQYLDLMSSEVTDAGLEYLKELKGLRYVNLWYRPITDAGLASLKGMTGLQGLNLNNTRITGAGLELLKGLSGLQKLHVRNTQVTDADLVHLEGLTELRSLDFIGVGITSLGLEHLKGLTKLRELNLGRTEVTDSGLAHLAELTGLTALWLAKTPPVTDVGLAHLKDLTKLQKLDLSGTQVTDATMADFIKNQSGLQELGLGGTQITDAGLTHLKGLDQLWLLNLDDTQITDAGLAHLKGLTGLQELGLCGTQITDGGLIHLKGWTRLQQLRLANTRITDTGLENLEGLTSLSSFLNLRDTRITDEGLAHLKGLTRLEALQLGDTQISGAGLAHLRDLPRLQVLWLDGTRITDAGLEHIKGLHLRQLDLQNTQITDAGLEHLKSLTDPVYLDLSGTQVTDAGVQRLKQSLPKSQIVKRQAE